MFLLHRLSDGTDEWLCETSELSPSHTASQGSAGMQARAAKREGEGREGTGLSVWLSAVSQRGV